MIIFTRFCILYLAIMWVGFGLLHFTHHDFTVAQIPDIFPFKSAITYVTGVGEVATGLFILSRKTRKWAALTSLILLVLLLPAMVKIMTEGSAVHGFIPIILVPGNLLLLLCSWYLWKKTSLTTA